MSVRVSLLFVLSLLLCIAGRSAMAAGGPDLVLREGKIYPSPAAEPIDDAVVLIRNGKIIAVAKQSKLKTPKSAQVVDCTGKVIVAGFWNSHVHFLTGWEDVPHTPAVFAHPQNYAGVDNALAGGVDVLAHTIPGEAHYTAAELSRMKQQHTALIPTLTLWTTVVPDAAATEKLLAAGVDELKSYVTAGGTILFGTDVDFQPKYDTTEELAFMGRAMPWRDVLASLTTQPSTFFKQVAKGRVEKGMDADLVVLNADPASDVRNLAKVMYTIRGGKIIYSSQGKLQ